MTPSRDDIVGVALPDESAVLHVTGAAQFVDDLREPAGTLHAALVLSPVAHGRLGTVDLDEVRALPGVVDVLSGADVPGENDCGTIIRDEPVLATGEVTYVGQPVLAVVAATHLAALHAATIASALLLPDLLPMQLDHRQAHADGDHVIPPMLVARTTAGTAVAQVIAAAPHRLTGTFAAAGRSTSTSRGRSRSRSLSMTAPSWSAARPSTRQRCRSWSRGSSAFAPIGSGCSAGAWGVDSGVRRARQRSSRAWRRSPPSAWADR